VLRSALSAASHNAARRSRRNSTWPRSQRTTAPSSVAPCWPRDATPSPRLTLAQHANQQAQRHLKLHVVEHPVRQSRTRPYEHPSWRAPPPSVQLQTVLLEWTRSLSSQHCHSHSRAPAVPRLARPGFRHGTTTSSTTACHCHRCAISGTRAPPTELTAHATPSTPSFARHASCPFTRAHLPIHAGKSLSSPMRLHQQATKRNRALSLGLLGVAHRHLHSQLEVPLHLSPHVPKCSHTLLLDLSILRDADSTF